MHEDDRERIARRSRGRRRDDAEAKGERMRVVTHRAHALARCVPRCRGVCHRPGGLEGQSLGAQVALEAAVRAPARVAALVLVGPSGDPRARTRWRTVLRAARTAPFERLALLLVVARDYLRAGPRFVWEEMTRMLAHHPERVLPRVAVPALVLRGARDAVCSAAWAREVAARLPAGEARTIPHAAHAVHWTRPDAVAAEIEGFLRDRA